MSQERKDQIFEILCDFFRECLGPAERQETLQELGITLEEQAELGF